MSLPHALLTALVDRPLSGSDLAARFDRSIGYFWNASHQQIYRELARLEADGLIRALPQETGRGRKRAYEILPQGRAMLRDWLGQGETAAPLRDEMMVRLWAEAALGSREGGPTDLVHVVRERHQAHVEKLALYRGFMARDFPDDAAPLDRARALRRLVLQAGITHEQMWIDLLSEAEAILSDDQARSRQP